MKNERSLNALLILEGKYEGKKPRGRPRRMWIDDVLQKLDKTKYQEVKRLSEDRKTWRKMTHQPSYREDGNWWWCKWNITVIKLTTSRTRISTDNGKITMHWSMLAACCRLNSEPRSNKALTTEINITLLKCIPLPLQHSVWPPNLTFDLWPWKSFQQCPLAWWTFVSSFTMKSSTENRDWHAI